MKFESRADLLIAAGESIKMQEKYGIDPVCKLDNEKTFLKHKEFFASPSRYEFPLAVVECKPVFVGDELYCHKGEKRVVVNAGYDSDGLKTLEFTPFANSYVTSCSWNPPKHKTVIVELLREDAEWLATFGDFTGGHAASCGNSARKALKETK